MQRHQSYRLRHGRHSEAGRIYVVTTVCNRRRPLLSDEAAAQVMVDEFLECERKARCTSMAYVVMPDHIHWMLQLLPGHELSKVVASVKGRASIRINRLNRTRGRFWQPNYYDHAVRREEDLENLAHYLTMNPVRAGLVDQAERYRYWWSAWHPRDRA